MNRTTVITLLGLGAAFWLAWRVGGALGGGIGAGFCSGAAISGLCVLRQQHTARYRPERVVRTVLEGFLFKLAFVLIGGLAFGLIESLGAVIDVRSFLISFAAAAAVVLISGTFETVQLLKQRQPTRVAA
jgi:hypothetical protein